MTDQELVDFQSKVYKGVLEDKILVKFSNLISDSISRAVTDTMRASFYTNTEALIISPQDLKKVEFEDGSLMTFIPGLNYPFLSLFLIKPQKLSILGDIINNREIGKDQNLGEMERSIALEINNVIQGSVVNAISDIVDQSIFVGAPKGISVFEIKNIINRFISEHDKNNQKMVFTKIDLLSGGVEFAKAVFVFGQPMVYSLMKMI
ncbi:MAG: hypothetical protein GW780_03900 [Candidatus Aenigmarchaeota archaeon]|nr:hypothetical protein [Candidatus Aenigmarchaeota archaeon]